MIVLGTALHERARLGMYLWTAGSRIEMLAPRLCAASLGDGRLGNYSDGALGSDTAIARRRLVSKELPIEKV